MTSPGNPSGLLLGARAGNASNPRVVSGAQQTRSPCAEKAVEVVRDHEGGTGSRPLAGSGRRKLRLPGVDARKVERQRGDSRANPTRGGTRGFFGSCEEFRQSGERSEGEVEGHEGTLG
jgi:hypothetical protein